MTAAFLILIALAAGTAIDYCLRLRIKQYPRFPIATLISIAAIILSSTLIHGDLPLAKGLLLAEDMIAISLCDGFTHEIPNWLLLPVFAAGLIGFRPLSSLFGMIMASVPILIEYRITRGGIGGADVKLMAAIGFALGASQAVIGAIAGLIASVPFGLFFRYHQKKHITYAWAPWLCSGCFFAHLFIGGIA